MSSSHHSFPPLPPADIPNGAIPNDDRSIMDLVKTHMSYPIYSFPILSKIAAGVNQQGQTKEKKKQHGEKILQLSGWDVRKMSDDDIRAHTGTLVFALSARLEDNNISKSAHEANFDAAIRLCHLAQESHLRACLNRVDRLACAVLRAGKELRQQAACVDALHSLSNRIPAGVFAATHVAFLEAVLLTRTKYDLTHNITAQVYHDVSSTGVSYLDILTFHHHAGLINALQMNYERARDLFVFAACAQAQAVSAIQVACAKRAILCEILISGQVLRFPKYISGAVNRSIERGGCEIYLGLAKAYANRDWAAVKAKEALKVFSEDCNLGLVKRVMDSIPRRRIKDVREVFSKISLGELAHRSGFATDVEGLNKTEHVLERMVTRGDIKATIELDSDRSKSVIAFLDTDEEANSPAAFQRLMQVNEMAKLLQRELTRANKQLGMTEAYLKKQADILRVEGKMHGSKGRGPEPVMMGVEDEMDDIVFTGRSGGGRVGGDLNDIGY